MPTGPTNKNIVILFVVIVIAIVAYGVLTMPDRRTPTEKLGDAVHDLDKGPDKALRQLQDRTPGQKLGDTIKDTTKSDDNK